MYTSDAVHWLGRTATNHNYYVHCLFFPFYPLSKQCCVSDFREFNIKHAYNNRAQSEVRGSHILYRNYPDATRPTGTLYMSAVTSYTIYAYNKYLGHSIHPVSYTFFNPFHWVDVRCRRVSFLVPSSPRIFRVLPSKFENFYHKSTPESFSLSLTLTHSLFPNVLCELRLFPPIW